MSIKSDKWIRRMAIEHKMIEPFEPGQVKEVNGQRVVSYGTSSYGYDVRCADEFKLFTNIYSAIVDPKNFDSKSFVDVKNLGGRVELRLRYASGRRRLSCLFADSRFRD